MTRLFDENGVVTASTLVEAGPCFITQLRTQEVDGYTAMREVPADSLDDLELGARIDASMFVQGEIVDVIGTSKGKGFGGVVKRYHFHGGPKTHGQSDRWRHSGSVGSGTTPGRTFKGMRMAGHLGDARVTVKNLRILSVDPERNLVALRGAIPGPNGGLVVIRKKVGEGY
jgi:large subunit ribosomal protein L3